MNKMLRMLREKFRRLAICESGQDMMEYGLLVTLLALACISSVQGVANSVSGMFDQVSQALGTTQSGGQPSGGGGHDGDHGH